LSPAASEGSILSSTFTWRSASAVKVRASSPCCSAESGRGRAPEAEGLDPLHLVAPHLPDAVVELLHQPVVHLLGRRLVNQPAAGLEDRVQDLVVKLVRRLLTQPVGVGVGLDQDALDLLVGLVQD
jgi:hypothetical protein